MYNVLIHQNNFSTSAPNIVCYIYNQWIYTNNFKFCTKHMMCYQNFENEQYPYSKKHGFDNIKNWKTNY